MSTDPPPPPRGAWALPHAAAHAIKTISLGLFIAALSLWAVAATESAVVATGSGRPPDSVCLYYSFGLFWILVAYYCFDTAARLAATGRGNYCSFDRVFLLMGFVLVAVLAAVAPSRGAFLGMAAFVLWPGTFLGILYMLPRKHASLLAHLVTVLIGSLLYILTIVFAAWMSSLYLYMMETTQARTAGGFFTQVTVILLGLLAEPAWESMTKVLQDNFHQTERRAGGAGGGGDGDGDGDGGAGFDTLARLSSGLSLGALADAAAAATECEDVGERGAEEEEEARATKRRSEAVVKKTRLMAVFAQHGGRFGMTGIIGLFRTRPEWEWLFWTGVFLDIATPPACRVAYDWATQLLPRWRRRARGRRRRTVEAAAAPTDAGEPPPPPLPQEPSSSSSRTLAYPSNSSSTTTTTSAEARTVGAVDDDDGGGGGDGGGARVLWRNLLHVDNDPAVDHHVRVARYTLRLVAALGVALFFSGDSPLLAVPAGAGAMRDACARRLGGVTVALTAGRAGGMVAANAAVDLVVVGVKAVRERRGRGRRRRRRWEGTVGPEVKEEGGYGEANGEEEEGGGGGHGAMDDCGEEENVQFVTLWTVVEASLITVVGVCFAVMFLRGSFILEGCGPVPPA
ncbi:hypothetical protein DFJ73DRAFT_968215 [Zopfochytrium polystomum]|nr:hypothetical protein DFJ73DRAFT_968215 [Zopfochytrium polystomum]